jgi:hypothetical protein
VHTRTTVAHEPRGSSRGRRWRATRARVRRKGRPHGSNHDNRGAASASNRPAGCAVPDCRVDRPTTQVLRPHARIVRSGWALGAQDSCTQVHVCREWAARAAAAFSRASRAPGIPSRVHVVCSSPIPRAVALLTDLDGVRRRDPCMTHTSVVTDGAGDTDRLARILVLRRFSDALRSSQRK